MTTYISLSQLGSGGAYNPTTDVLPTVRNGGGSMNPDVLTTLGTAATKEASASGDAVLASVTGSITAGHLAVFSDTAGTIEDGGVLGNAAHATASSGTGTLSAVNGGTTATHIAVFNDSAGTIHDTGLTSASFDAAGAAATAQSNAEAYASNASNLSSGTVASALLPLCSPTAFGACKVDNTTITESGGVISAVGGGGSSSSGVYFCCGAAYNLTSADQPLIVGPGGSFTQADLGYWPAIAACMPFAGTASKLYVNSNVAPGIGNTATFTLYKNGSATALTCSMANSSTTAVDTTDTVSFVAGDLLYLYCTLTDGGGSAVMQIAAGIVV